MVLVPENPDPRLARLVASLRDVSSLEELDEDAVGLIEDLVRERRAASRRGRRGGSATTAPQRTLALEALEVTGVPTAPKVLASVVSARSGARLDPRALSTIRRDDQKAWQREIESQVTPTPKVAPALHHELIEPVRAMVTNSVWHLATRMVTPHSPRADHPSMVMNLLAEAERLDHVDEFAARRITDLAVRLAAGLPGTARVLPDQLADRRMMIRRVAEEEFERFAGMAVDERKSAAQRALMVDDEARVWGRRGGSAGVRRVSGGAS